MIAVVSRALWLILASVAACAGMSWALWAFHDNAEHVLSVFALLRYAGLLAGPCLYAAIVLVSSIRECGFGMGC